MNNEPRGQDYLDQYAPPLRTNGGECPGCGRIMSVREGAEQGSCNDCYGAPYDPRDGE